MTFRRTLPRYVLLAAVMILALARCGGSEPAGPPAVVTLSLSPPSATLRVGATLQLSANAPATETVTFTVDNPSVVGVTSEGLLRAFNIGTAIITARTRAGATATATITVTAGPPFRVDKTTGDNQSGTPGLAVAVPPSVTVRDSAGNVLAGIPVIFVVASGGGSLAGGAATTTAAGVATVQSWTLGSTAGTNTLTATVAGVAPVTFTAVSTQAIIELSSTSVSFSAAVAGANPASQMIAVGNAGTGALSGLVIGPITYSGAASGWLVATLNRTTSPAGVTLTPSIATLPAGIYLASVPVSAPNVPNSPRIIDVTLTVGTPTALNLVVTTQPGAAASGALLSPQPVVEVRNAGTVVAGATNAVTASISGGTGTLSGTTTVASQNGVATFTSLRITGNGPHVLTFASSGVAPTSSEPFAIGGASGPSPTHLFVSTQPGGAPSGTAFAPQPVIQVRDANGDLVTSAATAVTATLNGAGGTLSGTTTVSAANGVATFAGLRVTGAGTYTLTFSGGNLAQATSSPFTITSLTQGTIELLVGATATATGAVGTNLAIPIIADMSNAAGRNLASLSFNVTWDPTKFDFVSTANGSFGSGGSFFVNTANQANGSIAVSMFDNAGFSTGTPTIYTVTLKPKASGAATVTANITVAGDANGNSIPSGSLSVRPLSVTTP